MATPSVGTIIPSLAFLDAIIQDNTLQRVFHDALYPELLYRSEAWPEKWEGNLGERSIFTRSSLLSVDTAPLTPGVDPQPENEQFEQWEVVAAQYGKSTDVNMPTSRTALASLFARKAKNLGLNAGQTLNRLARNRMFCAYTGGQTVTETTSGSTASIVVASINGFTQTVVNGQLVDVSATNPLAIEVGGDTAASVTAATPTDANLPYGPGTLTLASAIAVDADDAVIADNSATIVRSGGGLTVDALATTDILTLANIRAAVAELRRNRVPAHDDGFYHVHLDPVGENQLFSDTEFQSLNQSNYGDAPYQMFAVGRLLGCIFYTNSESPNSANSGTLVAGRSSGAPNARVSPEILTEVINKTSVAIIRTLVTGGGSLYESFIDESEYLSEAGVQGKIGGFNVVNNGLVIPIERVRYIIRAPQDRLQQQVSQSWSWSGDFGIPSDLLGGLTDARFKRAVVIESGSS